MNRRQVPGYSIVETPGIGDALRAGPAGRCRDSLEFPTALLLGHDQSHRRPDGRPGVSTESESAFIAGWRTADDWRAFAMRLRSRAEDELWRDAFDGYLMERLNNRYLKPI